MKNFLAKIADILLKVAKALAIAAVVVVLLFCFYSLMDFALRNFLPSESISVLSNFIIFTGIILFLIVKKINVSSQMETAVNTVNETIKESETARTESENKLSAIEESMKHLSEEIDNILEQSERNAKLVGGMIESDAQKSIAQIKENTQKAIENNRLTLKNDIICRASRASVEVAKAHIIEELNRNPDLHDRLINESIDAIEGTEI